MIHLIVLFDPASAMVLAQCPRCGAPLDFVRARQDSSEGQVFDQRFVGICIQNYTESLINC
jgi:hypothetical protein